MQSDVVTNLGLQAQWGGLGSVLVEAYNAVDEARSTFHPCAIVEIVQISPDTKTLVLAPRRSEAAGARDWHFGAGQHLIVKRMEPGSTSGGLVDRHEVGRVD